MINKSRIWAKDDHSHKIKGKITSNPSVIHQSVYPTKRVTSPLHGGRDGRLIRAHIERDRHRPDGGALRRSGSIYLLAEGPQTVGPPRGRDDQASGPGEVEAKVPADARGCASDHHDLAIQISPWSEPRRPGLRLSHPLRHWFPPTRMYIAIETAGGHKEKAFKWVIKRHDLIWWSTGFVCVDPDLTGSRRSISSVTATGNAWWGCTYHDTVVRRICISIGK